MTQQLIYKAGSPKQEIASN